MSPAKPRAFRARVRELGIATLVATTFFNFVLAGESIQKKSIPVAWNPAGALYGNPAVRSDLGSQLNINGTYSAKTGCSSFTMFYLKHLDGKRITLAGFADGTLKGNGGITGGRIVGSEKFGSFSVGIEVGSSNDRTSAKVGVAQVGGIGPLLFRIGASGNGNGTKCALDILANKRGLGNTTISVSRHPDGSMNYGIDQTILGVTVLAGKTEGTREFYISLPTDDKGWVQVGVISATSRTRGTEFYLEFGRNF